MIRPKTSRPPGANAIFHTTSGGIWCRIIKDEGSKIYIHTWRRSVKTWSKLKRWVKPQRVSRITHDIIFTEKFKKKYMTTHYVNHNETKGNPSYEGLLSYALYLHDEHISLCRIEATISRDFYDWLNYFNYGDIP